MENLQGGALMQPSPFIQALEVRWRVSFLWRVNAETCCASLSCEFTLDKREYKALCEISKTSNQKWGYLMYHIYSSLLCDTIKTFFVLLT